MSYETPIDSARWLIYLALTNGVSLAEVIHARRSANLSIPYLDRKECIELSKTTVFSLDAVFAAFNKEYNQYNKG